MARKPVGAAAKPAKSAAKKPARKSATRRQRDPDATVSALVILVVIAIIAGGGYLYQRNKAADAGMAPPVANAMEKK
jgi:hypothetical protein